MATIFTKIAQGEIPSWKVAESEDFYAFLDIAPLAKGHTLVIPKHVEDDYIFHLDEKTYEGAEMEALQAGYRNVILTQELERVAKEVGGHGGMDFIMDYRLVYCLRHGLPLDMDVYDLAEWCCVAPLSRVSLENGCMPVEVPDFTRGAWDRVKGFSFALAEGDR